MHNILETVEYNPLYGFDKNNALKEWSIKVQRFETFSKVIFSYGKVNGKKTDCILTIERGKNLGKKNETTHFTQALNEAEQRIRKKKNIDNYSEVKPDLFNSSQILLPMLAQDFQKHKHKLKFPCYVQPKLDGYRMIYDSYTKTCKSRTGKQFEILKDTILHNQLLKVQYPLDGELYVHDKSFKFENYGVLRKKTISTDKENLNRISYYVYDIPDEKSSFQDRKQLLNNLIEQFGDKIKIVPTFECNNLEEIDKYHTKFIEEGYEGTMVRNKCGFYKCKFRSHNLLKYKNFDDAEFEIIGFTKERDTGSNMDLVVWKCKYKTKTFNVQSKGTRIERNQLYQEGEKYVGKMLWVQFFGYTADGIPRFPKTYREGKDSIREIIL